MADQLMSNSKQRRVGETEERFDYSRPCMGLLIGYAAPLQQLFQALIQLEQQERVGNDQILLNIYYLQHPDAFALDRRCVLFQNLWRTTGGLYGSIHLGAPTCDIEVVSTAQGLRVRNTITDTWPCLIHAPLNLNMDPVVRALQLEPPPRPLQKGWHYWQYSLWHYVSRGILFFGREILLVLLVLAVLIWVVWGRGK